ncbi:MAG: hypothetical protein BWY76_00589 [bacterium ADurb.Bin429]|nr:MAG: hypothetical protein BWY76_00589 [bacterium ADurb.Bin429]
MLAEVPDYPIQMYRPPAAMSPEERDREVRALLARAALRVVLTRRTEKGGMALTGSRPSSDECATPIHRGQRRREIGG